MKTFIFLFIIFVIFVIFANRKLLFKNRRKSITDLKLETYEEQIEALKSQIYELRSNKGISSLSQVENTSIVNKEETNSANEKIQNLEKQNKLLKQKIKQLEEYIKEKENIQENQKDKKTIQAKKTTKDYELHINDEKDEDYINYVAGYYKLEGYDVYLNGLKKDSIYKELDVICRKDNDVFFLKCSVLDNKHKLSVESLETFVYYSQKYIENNNITNKNIKIKLIISDDILDYPSLDFIEHTQNLEYEVL